MVPLSCRQGPGGERAVVRVSSRLRSRSLRHLGAYARWLAVFADPLERRMADVEVRRPFQELHLDDQRRADPQRLAEILALRSRVGRERAGREREGLELREQLRFD